MPATTRRGSRNRCGERAASSRAAHARSPGEVDTDEPRPLTDVVWVIRDVRPPALIAVATAGRTCSATGTPASSGTATASTRLSASSAASGSCGTGSRPSVRRSRCPV